MKTNPSKKSRPKKKAGKRKVKGWAVLYPDGNLAWSPTLEPAIFWRREDADEHGRNKYIIAPCTITYSLIKKKK